MALTTRNFGKQDAAADEVAPELYAVSADAAVVLRNESLLWQRSVDSNNAWRESIDLPCPASEP